MDRHGSDDYLTHPTHQVHATPSNWVAFPGGELEGHPPKVMCPACREASGSAAQRPASTPRTLCFQCYRAEFLREKALRNAATLDTGSEARFQAQLPFEPVDRPRLQMLKAQRSQARVLHHSQFVERRRLALLAARRAVQAAGVAPTRPVKAGRLPLTLHGDRLAAIAAAIHAAELQLPESWIPFVVAR